MDSLLLVSFNKVIPKMFWQANKEWWSLDFILLAIEDSLQGVEATCDVTPKTVMLYFLSVFESDICFFYNILAVLAAN